MHYPLTQGQPCANIKRPLKAGSSLSPPTPINAAFAMQARLSRDVAGQSLMALH